MMDLFKQVRREIIYELPNKIGARTTQLITQDIKQFDLVTVYTKRRNIHKQSPHEKQKGIQEQHIQQST